MFFDRERWLMPRASSIPPPCGRGAPPALSLPKGAPSGNAELLSFVNCERWLIPRASSIPQFRRRDGRDAPPALSLPKGRRVEGSQGGPRQKSALVIHVVGVALKSSEAFEKGQLDFARRSIAVFGDDQLRQPEVLVAHPVAVGQLGLFLVIVFAV